MKKRYSLLFVFLFISSLLIGCGNNSEQQKMIGESSSKNEIHTTEDQTTPNQEPDRKIIQSADLTIETKNFTKSVTALEKSVTTVKGYIQTSSSQGTSYMENGYQTQTATYLLRIPSQSLQSYLKQLETIGNITSKTTTNEDITESYIDNAARLKSLQIQEERILSLLKKATELKDILELEKELSRIRYEIDSLVNTQQHFDKMISYSTVSINLIEVESLTKKDPTTLWKKITKQFQENLTLLINFFQGFIIFVFGNFPTLLLLAIVSFVIYRYLIKKKYKA